MWEFLSAHPVLGLAYLAIICLTLTVCMVQMVKFSPWLDADDDDEPERNDDDEPEQNDDSPAKDKHLN
jgi:hypothetical protein